MAQPAYEFGEFVLSPDERLLLRRSEPVPLTPKAFDTLVALVERRDRVAEKAELMLRLWPDHVVEEANLTQQIFTLRKALGDSPEGNLYIRTIPRHGYRFVAEVRLVSPPGAAAQPPPAPQVPCAAAGRGGRSSWRPRPWPSRPGPPTSCRRGRRPRPTSASCWPCCPSRT